MKKLVFGIALAAMVAFSTYAQDQDPVLNGVWITACGEGEVRFDNGHWAVRGVRATYTASNGIITLSFTYPFTSESTGTYSVSGNTLTLTWLETNVEETLTRIVYCPESDFSVMRTPDGNSVIITGYLGSNRVVRIPSRIRNLPVTHIGRNAFAGRHIGFGGIGSVVGHQLTRVTIPSSVIYIGQSAFWGNQLTEVDIPNNVTHIGSQAFMDNQLTSVTIPNGIIRIERNTFSRNQLTSVAIPITVTYIGDSAFADGRLTNVTISNSVTRIGMHAFARNQLTSVTIGDRVIHIGPAAFEENQLTSIIIPSSVRSIGAGAFMYNRLFRITIGSNVSLQVAPFRGAFGPHWEGFDRLYKDMGQRAGTFVFANGSWGEEW